MTQNPDYYVSSNRDFILKVVNMIRMIVILREDERKALLVLAETERRHPREQAAILIRRELERCGMLAEIMVSTNGDKEIQHAESTN